MMVPCGVPERERGGASQFLQGRPKEKTERTRGLAALDSGKVLLYKLAVQVRPRRCGRRVEGLCGGVLLERLGDPDAAAVELAGEREAAVADAAHVPFGVDGAAVPAVRLAAATWGHRVAQRIINEQLALEAHRPTTIT